jgi:hypothetical protein
MKKEINPVSKTLFSNYLEFRTMGKSRNPINLTLRSVPRPYSLAYREECINEISNMAFEFI